MNFLNISQLLFPGFSLDGEVVGMTIPQSKIRDFAELYFSLYNPKTKDRVDPMDRGGEYRSLLGLPGGTSHPSYGLVEEEATKAGFKLVAGKGNDPDTLGKQIVYVYDTKKVRWPLVGFLFVSFIVGYELLKRVFFFGPNYSFLFTRLKFIINTTMTFNHQPMARPTTSLQIWLLKKEESRELGAPIEFKVHPI